MNEAVGVLIVDEPQELEPVLRAVLEHEPTLQTIDEADLSPDGRASGPAQTVALVVLSAGAVDRGLVRIADLRSRQPRLAVLVAFDVLSADALRRLIDAGVDAFVARGAPPRDICAVILDIAGVRLPQAAVAPEAASADQADGLTPREAEILRFLSAGFSNKEVARRLNLSVRTVETHRLNLRRKTQTGRLKDLVALARKLGLAPVVDAEPPRRASGERASGEAPRGDRHRVPEAPARH